MGYKEQTEYKQLLGKIILNSADVAPEKVAAYIRRIASEDSYSAKQNLFDSFESLVPHLAKEYVDFALEYLIAKPEDESSLDPWGAPSSKLLHSQDLGIEDHNEFSPLRLCKARFSDCSAKTKMKGCV